MYENILFSFRTGIPSPKTDELKRKSPHGLLADTQLFGVFLIEVTVKMKTIADPLEKNKFVDRKFKRNLHAFHIQFHQSQRCNIGFFYYFLLRTNSLLIFLRCHSRVTVTIWPYKYPSFIPSIRENHWLPLNSEMLYGQFLSYLFFAFIFDIRTMKTNISPNRNRFFTVIPFNRFTYVAYGTANGHQSRPIVQGIDFTRWIKSTRWIYRNEDSMLWTAKNVRAPRSVQYYFVMCARRFSIVRLYSNVTIAPILERNLIFVRFVRKDSAHRAHWILIAGFIQVNFIASWFCECESNQHCFLISGEKPHKCIFCNKRFTASSNLYYHRMTHLKVWHNCSLNFQI